MPRARLWQAVRVWGTLVSLGEAGGCGLHLRGPLGSVGPAPPPTGHPPRRLHLAHPSVDTRAVGLRGPSPGGSPCVWSLTVRPRSGLQVVCPRGLPFALSHRLPLRRGSQSPGESGRGPAPVGEPACSPRPSPSRSTPGARRARGCGHVCAVGWRAGSGPLST